MAVADAPGTQPGTPDGKEQGMRMDHSSSEDAATARARFAAYRGDLQWPRVPLPIDLRAGEQMPALKRECRYAQLELGLAIPD